ncbi:putative membrane-associated protein [Desulfosporosinus orientis DSM 765]|uniref:Putative membrane-associated protein n=1 Tax=Desulfosporosinus orientis (strain ATCC 19365 / DSM 765 / NCIMB 8382 / VKM B-1628 / Singapore I) TaxID=768706 RepID=G7WFK5_DESOD|nr:DedA family protein [Desulfosporosinus orientis]AET68448.1 putative membrane-associated protein [Desulfosporosinus orientis DSM 765]
METILSHLAQFVINIISHLGYIGVFLAMAIESACIPLPSEIILPFTGYMVFLGRFGLWQSTLAATLGNLLGALFAYYIGRWGGRPFIKRFGRYVFIHERELSKTEELFDRHGELTVFIGRLLPVVRTFISLPAGIARMNSVKMSIYTVAGALPWCLMLIITGQKLGENWNTLKPLFHRFDIVIGIIIFLFIIYYLIKKKHLKR